MRIHQPDQAIFRSVLPEDIDWKPFPAFPPSARLAIVVGDPSEPGPYVIRVKLPVGRQADAAPAPRGPRLHGHLRCLLHRAGEPVRRGAARRLSRLAPSSCSPAALLISIGRSPAPTSPRSSAIGPLGLEYLDPIDDPRNK